MTAPSFFSRHEAVATMTPVAEESLGSGSIRHVSRHTETETVASPLVVSATPVHSSPARHFSPAVPDVSHDRAASLLGQCSCVVGIVESRTRVPVKRRRVAEAVGVLLEQLTSLDTMTLLDQTANAELCGILLQSLALAAHFLPRTYAPREPLDAFTEREEVQSWAGSSPYFPTAVNDALCLCLVRAATPTAAPRDLRGLLESAVCLELAETETLQLICQRLTSREAVQRATPAELVDTLRLISLAVKRCKLQTPAVDRVLCQLVASTLTPRESLHVLSSLLRLKEKRAVEVCATVSRKAVPHTAAYSAKDLSYALAAITYLTGCNEVYAGAVLTRCTTLAPTMSPTELGDVCKYVGLLNPTRRTNDVATTCAKELSRLLPALANRAEQLVGSFSFRDARYVLRCLTQHKVRHSLLFSRLTPIATNE